MRTNTFLVLLLLGIFQTFGITPSFDATKNVRELASESSFVDTLEDDKSNDFSFIEELNEEEEVESSESGSDSFLGKNNFQLPTHLTVKYKRFEKAISLFISYPNLYILYQVFRI